MTTFIDFHALQTLPPSNVNRGEDGAPKSAVFGGKRRQRISSQALKAAQRRDFKDLLDDSQLGTRTRTITNEIAQRTVNIDPSIKLEDAENQILKIFKLTEPKKKRKVAGRAIHLYSWETNRWTTWQKL